MKLSSEHQYKIQTRDPEFRAAFGAACDTYLMVNYPPYPVEPLYVSLGRDEL